MPIYEYQCEQCGVFETIQKFNDQPLAKCPTCQAANPKKIVSASAFHLKGGGWYKSDYGASGKSNTTSAIQEGSSDAPVAPAAKCNTGCKCH